MTSTEKTCTGRLPSTLTRGEWAEPREGRGPRGRGRVDGLALPRTRRRPRPAAPSHSLAQRPGTRTGSEADQEAGGGAAPAHLHGKSAGLLAPSIGVAVLVALALAACALWWF